MKFDTIIIGGGLAGLTCGLRLQKSGQKCAIISTGQSALHFSSGSFDLLNYTSEGKEVESPAEALATLPKEHPYHKIGDSFEKYAELARELLNENGVPVQGGVGRNHYRYTPMGTLRPTWLTFEELTTAKSKEDLPQGKILIANFAGFLDFNLKFVLDAFRKAGLNCDATKLKLAAVERLRQSPTEMRAANIAKALDFDDATRELIEKLNQVAKSYDWVVLPAVFGFKTTDVVKRLEKEVNCKIMILPTMPPSVPGVRCQMALRREFERAGGVFMMGDTILRADVENKQVKAIYSRSHEEIPLKATNFVLATGHFFSGGITSTIDSIFEPIFNCDVDFLEGRENWYQEAVLENHNYAKFGVATDEEFHAKTSGEAFENLYAVGSVLSGAQSMAEGSGAGVSMLTALKVADIIKGSAK